MFASSTHCVKLVTPPIIFVSNSVTQVTEVAIQSTVKKVTARLFSGP